jgi:hypothetical protein
VNCHPRGAQLRLARRAGTQLQTLIIDDGFGVLTPPAATAVEAINAVSNDFERIWWSRTWTS